jgi:hypothetical protein
MLPSLSLTISIAKPCTRSMTKLLQFIRSGALLHPVVQQMAPLFLCLSDVFP